MQLEHWESYYRTGMLATCPTAADGGYDREIEQAWVQFFSPLRAHARILDVATGNGAVVAIAHRLSRQLGRDWRIQGCDAARIDPKRNLASARKLFGDACFHSGVPIESMPFETARFEAVSGQYALEYARTDLGLKEIARVLKPGGSAQFIMHHAGSELVRNARASLAEAELVLDEAGIYDLLRRLVTRRDHEASLEDRATIELRSAIGQLKQAYQEAAASNRGHTLAVTLDAVRQLLAMRAGQPADRILPQIDRAERELRLSLLRLKDLLARASDREAIDGLQEIARSSGFKIAECTPQLHAGVNLVGWRVRLHRQG